jgi:hypothetical protein
MTVQRKIVSESAYRGKKIKVCFMGPDYLAYVDDREMSGFYISEQAAIGGAQTFINEELEAAGKK